MRTHASRIASQIVSGIGFLGAGQYFIGISAGLLLVLLQEILHRVVFLSGEMLYGTIQFIYEQHSEIDDLEKFFENKHIYIKAMRIEQGADNMKVELEISFSSKRNKKEVLKCLIAHSGIVSVSA